MIEDVIGSEVALRFEEFKAKKEQKTRDARNRNGRAFDVFH